MGGGRKAGLIIPSEEERGENVSACGYLSRILMQPVASYTTPSLPTGAGLLASSFYSRTKEAKERKILENILKIIPHGLKLIKLTGKDKRNLRTTHSWCTTVVAALQGAG